MKLKRSKNLDEKIIQDIVEIMDGWLGVLTWDGLVEAVSRRMGLQYTRQTLHKHERIKFAFAARKKAFATGEVAEPNKVSDPILQAALDRLARIEGENERLKRENANLLEQFVRWTYNAGTRGLGIEFLNQALPEIHRGQTDRKPNTKQMK
jgi:hypothetical protein